MKDGYLPWTMVVYNIKLASHSPTCIALCRALCWTGSNERRMRRSWLDANHEDHESSANASNCFVEKSYRRNKHQPRSFLPRFIVDVASGVMLMLACDMQHVLHIASTSSIVLTGVVVWLGYQWPWQECPCSRVRETWSSISLS